MILQPPIQRGGWSNACCGFCSNLKPHPESRIRRLCRCSGFSHLRLFDVTMKFSMSFLKFKMGGFFFLRPLRAFRMDEAESLEMPG